MTSKNFINFHVLISHSPSCLNRDDMNMQKTAVFGGVNRVRISSQSLKRTMRTSDYYAIHLGSPSFRTRDLERAKEELVESLGQDFPPPLIHEAALRFVSDAKDIGEDSDDEADDETAETGDKKKRAVAPWVVGEIREICQAIRAVREEGLTEKERESALKKEGKSVGKGKDKRTLTKDDCLEMAMSQKIGKRLLERIEHLRAAIGSAVDVALSGRMATSGIMLPVDGALAVAHAITTHAVEPLDVDWFTAVDDLTQDAGETGAGHLNTQQFSSGVFYRYASLNLKQLQVNLGLLADMKSPETAESRRRALYIARHAFHMLATVVPSAKQQSFAAHNLADFALVSFADQPISLANAFEQPVKKDHKNGGFLKPSIQSLSDYWARMNRAYGLEEQACAFAVEEGAALGGKPALGSLKQMEAWIANDGQA